MNEQSPHQKPGHEAASQLPNYAVTTEGRKSMVLKTLIAPVLILLLAACGSGGESGSGGTAGGGGNEGGGGGTPTTPETGIQGATCSDDSSGATGFVTCHELERLGGLALTALRLSSLGFSMGYDRAVARVDEDASPCPAGGTVGANLITGGAVESLLAACDFGVGPMTGTVVTLVPDGPDKRTSWEADVSVGAVRYDGTGFTDSLADSIPQVNLSGLITVGDGIPLTMTTASTLLPEDDGSLTYVVNAQHLVGTSREVNFLTTSNFDKTTIFEKENGFVVIDLPFTRTIRYLRGFSDAEALRVESAEANLEVDGRDLDGTLINTLTGQGETVSTTWDAAMAAARYDFAD